MISHLGKKLLLNLPTPLLRYSIVRSSTLARYLAIFLCSTLFLVAIKPVWAESTIAVEGVDGELKTNIELIVGIPPLKSEKRKFRRYIADLPALTNDALSALGFYSSTIKVRQETDGENTLITISVNPGDPVLIRTLNIDILGDGLDDPAFRSILGKIEIQKQSIFVSANYEATKALLQDRAQDLGYFDFAFTANEVRVSRKQLSADINLVADTGPRYTFGPIVFEQESLRVTFLNRWVPFAEGDPYESSQIGVLTQNLQNSGYFKSVRVQPQQDRRYGKTIPVKVDLTLRDLNQVALGIGFSTDIGLRTKLTWGKPIINQRGHSADFELGISESQQNASFSYRIPRRNEPLYNYWGIEYGLKNARFEDNDGESESFLNTVNFQRVSRTSSQWTETLFLRWEREESVTVKDGKEKTDLLLPGVSYTRTRSKGTPFPVWGQAASLQVLGGSERAFSSIDFFKVLGSFRYLRAISNRNTIIAAAQYGAIQSNDYPKVPVSQRFFAGGDRSVRGFKYRELSPEGEDGGRYLEVLSLEYNYRFRDQWSGAVFADAGRAFNNFSSPYSVGAGFGIRWQSPVGPFRIDIATPISDNDDGGVRVHISLGPDL